MKIPADMLEKVKADFYEEGISMAAWARANDFPVHLVYAVINGRSNGSRGESHRIAIKLGLKARPERQHL